MTHTPIRAGVELAWAAGAFEGEGTVTAAKGKYIHLAITQNGGAEAREFLARFVRAVGVGKVYGPYDYSASSLGSKPRYVVQYQNRKHVAQVMAKLAPFLTPSSPKLAKYRSLISPIGTGEV